MASFPHGESKVTSLAMNMMAGYDEHATDFPSADPTALTTAFGAYMAAKNAQNDAIAAGRLATESKDAAITALEELMHNELKKSEVDVAADPEKLELIGWGPRVTPSPLGAPGQPMDLDPIVQGLGTLLLTWKSPAHGSGGTVRTYVIERREEPAGGGEFNEWTQVGIAIDCESTLTSQPRGVQMEYRVKAVNTGGESMPSNVAPVVL